MTYQIIDLKNYINKEYLCLTYNIKFEDSHHILIYKNEIYCIFNYDKNIHSISQFIINPNKNKINVISELIYLLLKHHPILFCNDIYDFDFIDTKTIKYIHINNSSKYIIVNMPDNIWSNNYITISCEDGNKFKRRYIYKTNEIKYEFPIRLYHKIIFEKPFYIDTTSVNYFNISLDNNVSPKFNFNNLNIISYKHDNYLILFGFEYDEYENYYKDVFGISYSTLRPSESMILFRFIDKYNRCIIDESDNSNFELLKLPILIINNIISYLDNRTIYNFRLVNKKCNTIFDKCNIVYENNIVEYNKFNSTIKYISSIDFNCINNLTKLCYSCINVKQQNIISEINKRFNKGNKKPKIYFNVSTNLTVNIIQNIIYISSLQINDTYNSNLYNYILRSETKNYIRRLTLLDPNIDSMIFANELPNLDSFELIFQDDPNPIKESYDYLLSNLNLINKIDTISIIIDEDSYMNWINLLQKCKNVKRLSVHLDIREINIQDVNKIYECISNMTQLSFLYLYPCECEWDETEIILPNNFFLKLTSLKYLSIKQLNEEQCKDLKYLKCLYINEINPLYIKYMDHLSILLLKDCLYPYYKYHHHLNISLRI